MKGKQEKKISYLLFNLAADYNFGPKRSIMTPIVYEAETEMYLFLKDASLKYKSYDGLQCFLERVFHVIFCQKVTKYVYGRLALQQEI
jgi:hypothetical protein